MQNFITIVMNSLKSMSVTAVIDILVVAFIFYKGYIFILYCIIKSYIKRHIRVNLCALLYYFNNFVLSLFSIFNICSSFVLDSKSLPFCSI